MNISEAIEILMSLASNNVIDEKDADTETLVEERDQQLTAIEGMEAWFRDNITDWGEELE